MDPVGHHELFVVAIDSNEDIPSPVEIDTTFSSQTAALISKFDCPKELLSKRAGLGITQGTSERPLGIKLSPPETPWSNLPGGDLVVWRANLSPLSLHTLPAINLRKLCDRLLLDAATPAKLKTERFW